ncbi:hypothetical protein HQN86_08565 [Pedobacter panaciterrae]|uniref:hypothetical protein n=1 Tax=Pedobacter panaciterrae TaxID=363849 RepID=UPI00155DA555|nr:hypothetical protein [Pedobacter panaciterrae]NQX53663.1 hypothetical protein [Pedobacter panaciterrae]
MKTIKRKAKRISDRGKKEYKYANESEKQLLQLLAEIIVEIYSREINENEIQKIEKSKGRKKEFKGG